MQGFAPHESGDPRAILFAHVFCHRMIRRVVDAFPMISSEQDSGSQIEEGAMAKRPANQEAPSKRAASAAAKVLRDPKRSKAAKIAAGYGLTQHPGPKKK